MQTARNNTKVSINAIGNSTYYTRYRLCIALFYGKMCLENLNLYSSLVVSFKF